MIDKDGKFEYSPVKMVTNSSNFHVNIYPIPVKQRLTLQVQSNKTEKAQIVITDISGKALITTSLSLAAGINTTSINVQRLTKGAYFLKVVTTEGTETRKIAVE
jgi:hypothetical protein